MSVDDRRRRPAQSPDSPREQALREPPCSFCGVAIGGDTWTCKRCNVKCHPECFWGRMATLEEWITYFRRIMETDDDFEADVVCAACRQLEGLGEGGGMMTTAKLVDVKMVLFSPMRFQSRRKAISEAQVAYGFARINFGNRATPATWVRLVAASRKLHATVKAEETDWKKRAEETQKVGAP